MPQQKRFRVPMHPVQGYSHVPGCTLSFVLSDHTKAITIIRWSPDGAMLASASSDHTIRLWDAQSGTLRHLLSGHTDGVTCLDWFFDGSMLASGSVDNTIRLWDTQTGELSNILAGHQNKVFSVRWSPDGTMLASASSDHTIRLWDSQTGKQLSTLTQETNIIRWSPDGTMLACGASKDRSIQLWDAQAGELRHKLIGHEASVRWIAWSLDGAILASASNDHTIQLWDAQTGELRHKLIGHTDCVRYVTWSPDGAMLASGSADNTIRLWDGLSGLQKVILEAPNSTTDLIEFSSDGSLIASLAELPHTRQSIIGTVSLWRTDTYSPVTILKGLTFGDKDHSLGTLMAFHPQRSTLAIRGTIDTDIFIWNLDLNKLQRSYLKMDTVHYANAKVVLMGDSGVGKSGLGLVLAGMPFKPTESTHGRNVWTLDRKVMERNSLLNKRREILLWDLAGQPGYRLIHQLHLREVTVALVVIDGKSETDPLAGVYYWNRALQQERYLQGDTALPLKKFLVAARSDRGGIGISRERIQTLMQELGFDGYFETSAKEGRNISLLKQAIRKAIDWKRLPVVSSTHLFRSIRAFLIAKKEAGGFLLTFDVLYQMFLDSMYVPPETEDLQAQFEACIGRVESTGLIQHLSFGDLVLLQPELLDAYASALISAVRDEPDGLGSISEERVRSGDFRIPKDIRILNKEQEKLLLIAMVEDLLKHELVLREGSFLVFPSQSTRVHPDLPDPEDKEIVFVFEGAVFNIYSTLAVRLSNSGLFTKNELWRNAIKYTTKMGGTFGMFFRNLGEGRGELILFFDTKADEQMRFYFEDYVSTHLQRKALPQSIHRRRIFMCSICRATVTEEIVQIRLGRGLNWLNCSACDTRISLLDRQERLKVPPTSHILEMDLAADLQREREAAQSIIQGKKETNHFDVFLCHHNIDKAMVKVIGEQLKDHGILPWLDEWELPPGRPWQRLLESQIKQIRSAAVFVGKNGVGPWEHMEIEALLRQFVKRDCPVIPVILADTVKEPQLPVFLEGMTWVDFRLLDPDPLERLIWGIIGHR